MSASETRKKAQLNDRLKKSQYIFRRGFGSTDHILTLKDIIKQYCEHNRAVNMLSGLLANATYCGEKNVPEILDIDHD